MYKRLKSISLSKPQKLSKKTTLWIVVVLFILIGVGIIFISRAATPSFSVEPESSGERTGCATIVNDATASGGASVQFGGSGTSCAGAGARLPISIDTTLGTYVATNGDNSPGTGTGTKDKPYATLQHAIANPLTTLTGDDVGTIIVRGGTYYGDGNSDITTSRAVKIIAYKGETPIFTGAEDVSSTGWADAGEGRLKRPYTPQPFLSDPSFSDPANFPNVKDADGNDVKDADGNPVLNDIGRRTDQLWVGDKQYRQVKTLAELTTETDPAKPGKFYVPIPTNLEEPAPSELYMMATDVSKGNIQVSRRKAFIYATRKTTLEGLRITRFGNSPKRPVVIFITPAGASYSVNGSVMRNVEISGSAFATVLFRGGSSSTRSTATVENPTIIKDNLMQNVTITESNWMGVVAMLTNDLKLDAVKISGMNPFGEFKNSPQSGALKTSRTHRTIVTNSEITNNGSHGLWFDESNYDIRIANNQITGNRGAGVFFEISDKLLLANNYISSAPDYQPVKMAGSSGLRLINNTIVGDKDPIGLYTDSRSKENCWNRAREGGPCGKDNLVLSDRLGALGSNWDKIRVDCPHATQSCIPATMDWKPRLDLMQNNIIAYPKSNGLCATTAFCITPRHRTPPIAPAPEIIVNAPINTIIHKADDLRGIPQTIINGNVYALTTDGGSLIRIGAGIDFAAANYTTLLAFRNAMAPPSLVDIGGFELLGRVGNSWVNADGSPTDDLKKVHNTAVAVPTDELINQYLAAGIKHFGVTYR